MQLTITSEARVLNSKACEVQGRCPGYGYVGAKPPIKIKNIIISLNLLSPECITRVKYKINHISKTKNRTKKLMNTKSDSEHCALF